MSGMLKDRRRSDNCPREGAAGARRIPATGLLVTLAAGLALSATAPRFAHAIGESMLFDMRAVDYEGGNATPRESAPRRLAWEVRKRTSIEARLTPSRARLDDPTIFETPFLYFAGDRRFAPLSEGEIAGLRRFVDFGGFIVFDDASPEGTGFDESVRALLSRAFPATPLAPLAATHTLYRSFYLLERPVGRVRGPAELRGIERDDRLAVVVTRHDLGGAWARDNLGTWEHPVAPGGERQREMAIRLGVNLVMYALCLDYKDDQVHAPFIMRRRGGAP